MSHNKNYVHLINTMRWRKLRHAKLCDSPLCERCLDRGLVSPAQEVHHIRPVESVSDIASMKTLAYDINNLMSLCSKCHHEIHDELMSHTKSAVAENNKRKTDQFISRYYGKK